MKHDPTDGMIEGRDIICFANDWDSDPLSKKHIMLQLAKRNRVLWVNSIGTRNPQVSARDFRRSFRKLQKSLAGYKRQADNLFLYSPLAVPFHGNSVAQMFNRQWLPWCLRRILRQLDFRNPITWTFLPTSADVVGSLGEGFILYHCVDEFSEFTGTNKTALLEMERRLSQRANLVIVSSDRLYENKQHLNPNTFLVRHGVDVEHFRNACSPTTVVPNDVVTLRPPVIGFHGLIADWVDIELIRFLASARPQWSFALIGKLEMNAEPLRRLTNVHLLGTKEYALLPACCKGFDVAILPFVINELTLAANPLKLREYLAAGLPVVSTAIPEAARLGNLLRLGVSCEHFLQQIEALLAEGNRGPSIAISKSMDSESWDERVMDMCRLISSVNPKIVKKGIRPPIAPGFTESLSENA